MIVAAIKKQLFLNFQQTMNLKSIDLGLVGRLKICTVLNLNFFATNYKQSTFEDMTNRS